MLTLKAEQLKPIREKKKLIYILNNTSKNIIHKFKQRINKAIIPNMPPDIMSLVVKMISWYIKHTVGPELHSLLPPVAVP